LEGEGTEQEGCRGMCLHHQHVLKTAGLVHYWSSNKHCHASIPPLPVHTSLGVNMACMCPHPQGKARPTELMKVGSTLYRRMAQLSLQQTTAAMLRGGAKPGAGGAGAAAASDTDGPQGDESGPALELKGRSPSSGQEVGRGAGGSWENWAGHGIPLYLMWWMWCCWGEGCSASTGGCNDRGSGALM
jgi:hypothetical protein